MNLDGWMNWMVRMGWMNLDGWMNWMIRMIGMVGWVDELDG